MPDKRILREGGFVLAHISEAHIHKSEEIMIEQLLFMTVGA